MVMAPHWGDHSLSVDLRIDEIPSTGGHRFFAHWQSSELRLVQDDNLSGSKYEDAAQGFRIIKQENYAI